MWTPEEEQPFTLEDEPSTPTPDGSPSQHSTHSGLSTFGPRNGYAPAGGLPASSQVCWARDMHDLYLQTACGWQVRCPINRTDMPLALTHPIPCIQPQHDFESAHVNHTYTAAGRGQQRMVQPYPALVCHCCGRHCTIGTTTPIWLLTTQTGSGSTSQRASTTCRPTARCIGSGCGVNLTGQAATLRKVNVGIMLLSAPAVPASTLPIGMDVQAGLGQVVHDGIDRRSRGLHRLPDVPVHQHSQQHQVRVHVLARAPCRVRCQCTSCQAALSPSSKACELK